MRCNYAELVKMKRAKSRTWVKVSPTGTAVSGYQVNLGNRPSLRDIGVVGAPAWTAEQTETWVRTSVGATCPRRLIVFEGGRRDIDRCMEFGDDFDGTMLNTAKWTTVLNGGSVVVSGGQVALACNASDYTAVKSTITFCAGYVMRCVGKSGHKNISGIYEDFGFDPVGTAPSFLFESSGGAGSPRICDSKSSPTYTAISSGWTANTFAEFVLRRTLEKTTVTLGGITTSTNTHAADNTAAPIAFDLWGSGASITVQRVLVCKYVAAEPVSGTAQPSALNRSMCQSLNLADGLRACIK